MSRLCTFETKDLPLVLSSIRGRPTALEVEEYVARAEAFYAYNTRRFVLLADLSDAQDAGARERLTIARHLLEHAPYFKRYLVAAGYVVQSRLVRGMLTAVFWVAQPKWQWRVFDSTIEARRWLDGEMQRDTQSGMTDDAQMPA